MKINALSCTIAIFLGGVVALNIPEKYLSKLSIGEIVLALIVGIIGLSVLLVRYSEMYQKG